MGSGAIKWHVHCSVCGAFSNKCNGCPYGKPVPCIGYCIASLYSEMRAKKGSG